VGACRADTKGPHRPRDVLDLLFAHVLEGDVELVADLVAHHPADADSARLGQGFETGGDVDPIAVDVALVDDDVADINADAELDALFRGHADVALGHPALQIDRAAHRVDDAGEFDEEAIAGGLDDAAAVFDDLGVEKLAPVALQCGERAFLVQPHQPRVAGNIGGKDRGKAALNPFLSLRHRPILE